MILVTGGAGFIGSVLVKELNNRGRKDILIVDRLRDTTKWKNLNHLKYEEYIHADDLFSGHYDELMEYVDFIFHMGACSATTEKDMDYLMRNNVAFSQSLCAFAIEKDIPFIYASSAATYGDGELGYNDDHEKLPELRPLNPYGYSKQLFDEWILKCDLKPSHWFGLKFFNVFGPNEYHKEDMRSLVHKAFGQIKEVGSVKLFKSYKDGFAHGEQLRDFIYVKDLVRAMIEMMNPSSAKFSGIYNMGTGNERSFLDLVHATFKALEAEPKVEFIEMPESIRDQYQYFTKANMDKFKKFLPNFKFTSLEDAVSDYVKNHLDTNNPYV